MRPIGIALIGYGGIGRVHALAYRSLQFHYGLSRRLDSDRRCGNGTR